MFKLHLKRKVHCERSCNQMHSFKCSVWTQPIRSNRYNFEPTEIIYISKVRHCLRRFSQYVHNIYRWLLLSSDFLLSNSIANSPAAVRFASVNLVLNQ